MPTNLSVPFNEVAPILRLEGVGSHSRWGKCFSIDFSSEVKPTVVSHSKQAGRPSTTAPGSCSLCCRGSRTPLANRYSHSPRECTWASGCIAQGHFENVSPHHYRSESRKGLSTRHQFCMNRVLTQTKEVEIGFLKNSSSVVKAAAATILETPHCPRLLTV